MTTKNNNTDDELTDFHQFVKRIIIAICVFIVVLVGIHLYNFLLTGKADQASFAQFGDYIGGLLNPVLGFSTVLLLIYSIRIQAKELKNTSEELALTREEMKLANEEAKRSAEAMVKQSQIMDRRDKLSATLALINHYKEAVYRYREFEWEFIDPVHMEQPHTIPLQQTYNQIVKNWRSHTSEEKEFYKKYFDYMCWGQGHVDYRGFHEQLSKLYLDMANEIGVLIESGVSYRACEQETKWLSEELRDAEDLGIMKFPELRACFEAIEDATTIRQQMEPDFPSYSRKGRSLVR